MRLPRPSFLALAFIAAFGRFGALAEETPMGRFEAVVELPKDGPYVGEPLRLKLRSALHARVANDRILQPALTDFDWRQFGVDVSNEELIDGFWLPVHTRTLMIYPLRSGRLTIEPFKWRVVYLTGEGERTEIELQSQPLTVEVRPREGLGDSAAFWLPAKSLRILDRWEPDPDKIPPGEMAKRTVTIEAEGLTADRLPPLPRFRAPGVITFAGPVERQTIGTDQGPVARAIYQWTVRPVSTHPAVAPAISLRWFDISARAMRETAAPERRVAFIGAEPAARSEATDKSSGLLSPLPLLAALLGFMSTGAAAYLIASSRRGRMMSWRRSARTWGLLMRLRAAARKGDVAAFRRTMLDLSKMDPDRWRRVASRDDIAAALATIDAGLFAREPPAAPAPLPLLARNIGTALRDAETQEREASS